MKFDMMIQSHDRNILKFVSFTMSDSTQNPEKKYGTLEIAKKVTSRRIRARRPSESLYIPKDITENHLFDSFYIYGTLPWEKNSDPVLLYKSDTNRPKEETQIQTFCFPKGVFTNNKKIFSAT